MQNDFDKMLQEMGISTDVAQIKAMFTISNVINDYENASDQAKINLVNRVKNKFFKEIDEEQNKHLKAALERINTLGKYIEQLSQDTRYENYLINGKIKHIRDLYNVIKNIKQDSQEELLVDEIYTLYQTIQDCQLSTYMHDEIIAHLKSNKDNIMVFSIGSRGNPGQYKPKFINDLTGNVIVCNFDVARYETENTDVANDKHKINFFSNVSFPLDPTSFGSDETKRIGDKRIKILNQYIQLTIEKKRQQPDFKLVLLFCCNAFFDKSLIEMAKAWRDSGFSMDDLKLVHDYHEKSPAVIYNDIDAIPAANKLFVQSQANLMDSEEIDKEQKIKKYTKEHAMTFYSSINDISSEDLFNKKLSNASNADQFNKKSANQGVLKRMFFAIYNFFKSVVNYIYGLFVKQNISDNSNNINTQLNADKVTKNTANVPNQLDPRLSKPYVGFSGQNNEKKDNEDVSPTNINKPGNNS